jgi:hypothetical protein
MDREYSQSRFGLVYSVPKSVGKSRKNNKLDDTAPRIWGGIMYEQCLILLQI